MKLCVRLLLVILLSVAGGCDMLEHHPYATNVHGKTHINNENIAALEASGLRPPFKFVFFTDTQGNLDELRTAIDEIRQRGDIDFMVHGGDMTDFGIVKEFVWCRDILENARLPYVAVIGNHDCLGNGNDTFDYIFGDEDFSFNIGPVHFLCLNTVALEYDYSRPVPDFDFITSDIISVNELNAVTPDSISHTIVVMHSRPYDEQFNNNVAKPFNLYLEQYPGMRSSDERRPDGSRARGLCLNGHNHSTSVRDIFDNGILYYQCANMGKRTFFVFTVTSEGYEYEEVRF